MVGNGLSWAFALMAPFVGTLLIILSVTNALEWSTAGRTFAVVASLIMIPIGLFAWWYQYFDGAQKMRDFEEEFERL